MADDDDDDGINLESLASEDDAINLSNFEANRNESLILKGIKDLRKKRQGKKKTSNFGLVDERLMY